MPLKFSDHAPVYSHVRCEPGAHRDEALAARGAFGPTAR